MLLERVRKELFVDDMRVRSPTSSGGSSSKVDDTILEINLGRWNDYLDINEAYIASKCSKVNRIALILKYSPYMNPALVDLICKYISPKLVELSIIDSPSLTWIDHIRKIMEPATLIEVINFQNNVWLDDTIVDQISKKFNKTIKELNFENTSITDSSLFCIGIRCLQLRVLKVTCCPKISDTGFLQISKKINLSTLHISHNVFVNDDSLEAILSNSHNLKSLWLHNCPKLTDRSMHSLYEKVVSWGRTRNNKSYKLEEIDVSDNTNFTLQVLTWLSAAAPTLSKLNISNCPAINLSKGLHEIESFTALEHLYMGPPEDSVNPDKFLESISYHISSLKTLHLNGFQTLNDKDLSELFVNALVLTDLSMIDMNFGSLSIEEVCSQVPNMIKICLIGSNFLTDLDVRCLTSTCIYLKELTISRCRGITDNAFARCPVLKRLSKLDVQYVSPLCNGSLLSCFAISPIRTLVLDGMTSKLKVYLQKLSGFNMYNIEELSLRNCQQIDEDDIMYILEYFPKCRLLDLSGCSGVFTSLFTLKHVHPFLVLTSDSDFIGYKLSSENRFVYYRMWMVMEHIQKHRAANKLIRLRMTYLKKLEAMRRDKDNLKAYRRLKVALWLQSMHRMRTAIEHFRPMLAAGRRIVRAAIRWHKFRYYRKVRKANRHYRHRIQNILLDILKIHSSHKKAFLYGVSGIVVSLCHRKVKKRVYKYMKTIADSARVERFYDSTLVHYDGRLLRKTLGSWKLLRGTSTERRRRMMIILNNIFHVHTLNSYRQLALVNAADDFIRQRIILKAWLSIGDDYMRAKLADTKLPQAITYYQRSFFSRVVGNTFNGLYYYYESKFVKRKALAIGIPWHPKYNKRVGIRRFKYNANLEQVLKYGKKVSVTFFRRTWLAKGLIHRWPIQVLVNRYQRDMDDSAWILLCKRRIKIGFKDLKAGCIRMRQMRELEAVAYKHAFIKYTSLTYKAWHYFTTQASNMDAYYTKWYLMKLCRLIVNALKSEVIEAKKYMDAIKQQMEQKNVSSTSFKEKVKCIIKFQAHIRGGIGRKRMLEFRSSQLYSVLLLQNWFRVTIAKMVYRNLKRKLLMKEQVQEMKECELMKEEDVDSEYIRYHHQNAIRIQRIFRGFNGRKEGMIIVTANVRERNVRFYDEMDAMRRGLEARRRALEYAKKKRSGAATSIQKRVRGMQERKRHIIRINNKRLNELCIYVQTRYRKKLGTRKLESLRREKFFLMRYRAARNQRGMLLRGLGFMKRSNQRVFLTTIGSLGMDPLTYNYRIKELIAETVQDFKVFTRVFKREYGLFKQHRFNSTLRLVGRNKVLSEQGVCISVHDSVIIKDPTHQYFGKSGIIVSIDSSIAGSPLYEILLDGENADGKQLLTYLNMTTDPLLFYSNPQPLAKIPRRPILEGFTQPFVVYGLSDDNPLFHRDNVTAALTVQCAYRVYRAKKLVARRRYEFWCRSADFQASILNSLADVNGLTTQSNNTLIMLGLRPKKPVFYDEIRHPLVPLRYVAVTKKVSEEISIQNEFLTKYRQRIQYLEKCAVMRGKEYFSIGYERFTRYRKLGIFWRKLCGFSKPKYSSLSGTSKDPLDSLKDGLIDGLDKYMFKQFVGSPHVRYHKQYMYQGQWMGVPFISPMHPHGEGIVIFMDGWGFAKEDKVLYITINHCRYLNAMDLSTSDPFCEISCNGTFLQTSVKWRNLNPDFYESFEIDVTNPKAKCNITVYDKDYIGSDDFMGQIELDLTKYISGKTVTETFLLKGEDIQSEEDFDRGEINISVTWTARKFEDDLARIQLQKVKSTKLQAWIRTHLAKKTKVRYFNERTQLLDMIRLKATMINNICRIRLARKGLRRLLRRHRSAIRIQKRVRIRQAKRKVRSLLRRYRSAVTIQALMRGCIARSRRSKAAKDAQRAIGVKAIVIQKWGRRLICQQWLAAERARIAEDEANAEVEELDYEVEEVRVKVSDWIGTYGNDPEYGLKRNRRMIHSYFQRMLKIRYMRLYTKRYGIVYVDKYPSDRLTGELEAAVNCEDFVSVYIPTFKPEYQHHTEAVEELMKYSHVASIHISEFLVRASSELNINRILCAIRQRFAMREKAAIKKLHAAIAKFQRIFRRRNESQQIAAIRVVTLFRLRLAKKRVNKRRTEMKSAIIIASAYLCHRARRMIFDFRSVDKLVVLKESSFITLHGADRALELAYRSYWLTDDPEMAEVRVELGKADCISEIWIQSSMFEASPQTVVISTVVDKSSKKFETLVRAELPLLKGDRWHTFKINPVITKYFKLTFRNNYGDPNHIGVRQIRFLRRKEKSAVIVTQPERCISDEGPMLDIVKPIVLRCEVDGWPRPTLQWYKGSTPIPGATTNELRLFILCKSSSMCRPFRCIKCKMVSPSVPINAYVTKCSNCLDVYSETMLKEYLDTINKAEKEEEEFKGNVTKYSEIISQISGAADPLSVKLLKETQSNLQQNLDALQALYEYYYSTKTDIKYTSLYADEGIYTCCAENIRGTDMRIVAKTVPTVVCMKRWIPYYVKTRPAYVPRVAEARKKWTTYSSILGTFRKGRVEGLVTIYYADGSFYEGPYLSEEWLDSNGRVLPSARSPDHYGVFKCADGRTFEGKEVDNHFDSNNVQSIYKLTLPNGEVYEGSFCDEVYHGLGIYTYKDGSKYEGLWFRGNRFGHGLYMSSEGWTYEGFFDVNRRHIEGMITWADGSFYIGDWYYDSITGKGAFVSHLRDIYRGQLKNGLAHGHGQLIYSNGSIYSGMFKEGNRHGKGIFSPKNGCEFFGQFVDDELHGEVIIKQIIPVEEKGQSNYDIRLGLYDNGKFVKYKSKASNPLATKQFISLFKENRDMYNSVYAMQLAKKLPNLPAGVDMNSEDVRDIIFRIRSEAGGLMGLEAVVQAQKRFEAILVPVKTKRDLINTLNSQIEQFGIDTINTDRDIILLKKKIDTMAVSVERSKLRLEQFWIDDRTESKAKFLNACEGLKKVTKDEYFNFRNHRTPPPYTKSIMECIAICLGWSTSWDMLILLVSDSVYNGRMGQEDALRYDYDCKLIHMMKTFNVFDCTNNLEGNTPTAIDNRAKMTKILVDPRFKKNSYYVMSCGVAAPYLVEWIMCAKLYISNSAKLTDSLAVSEERSMQLSRYKAQLVKKQDEYDSIIARVEQCKRQLVKAREELEEAELLMLQAKDMYDFIKASIDTKIEISRTNYYELLEHAIESKKEQFQVESAMEFIVISIENNHQRDIDSLVNLAKANGEVYVEPPVLKPLIRDWLMTEVKLRQSKILDGGQSLGYSFEPQVNAITYDDACKFVNMCVNLTIGNMNERYNDFAHVRAWTMLNGKLVTSRCLYIACWNYWAQEAIAMEDAKSISAWESAFADPAEWALKALEAKVNERMAAGAREQGRIWAEKHPIEMLEAESVMANQFHTAYPSTDSDELKTARQALEISEMLSGSEYDPTVKAQCMCWIRLNPSLMTSARDEYNAKLAEEFKKKFTDTANSAFDILNGLCDDADDYTWLDKADNWRTFNTEEYNTVSNTRINMMAAAFKEAYPDVTHVEAARIINNEAIAKYIRDEAVAAEYKVDQKLWFNAHSYAVRNQGIVKAATEKINAENVSKATRHWLDLIEVTNNFTKGSYSLTSPEGQKDPSLDRFKGFRDRLENIHSWFYGYLCTLQEKKLKELEEIEYLDPLSKVPHRIRPSEQEKIMADLDKKYIQSKKKLDADLNDVFTKVGTWTTYFGYRDDSEQE